MSKLKQSYIAIIRSARDLDIYNPSLLRAIKRAAIFDDGISYDEYSDIKRCLHELFGTAWEEENAKAKISNEDMG